MQYSDKHVSGAAVPVALAMAVCAGVLFPAVSELAAPLVFPALFLLLTFSLSLVTDRPLAILARPDPAVWGIMLWQMAFVPLLVIFVGWAIELPADLHLMLLATAVSGSVFATPTIANLLRLNSRLPINGMVVSTFLVPITLFVFGEALEGDRLDLSLSQYGSRVTMFLLVPLILSVFFNRYVKRLPQQRAATVTRVLRIGAVGSLLVFGVGIMDGVAATIETDPYRALSFLTIALGFAVATAAGTFALFWAMGRDLTIAATILSVYRNLGLTYALIGTAAGHDFAIYVAIFQVPLFLSPLVIYLIQFIKRGTAAYSVSRQLSTPPGQ